jgi:hypothetical protein
MPGIRWEGVGDWRWGIDSRMRRRVIWRERRRMNWRRECSNIESEDERTPIAAVLGDFVSGTQGIPAGHTVDVAETVVGVEG